MIDWQQRPIDQWPGELTAIRQQSRFDAPWGKTKLLLERELDMLNARGAVMLVALERKDFRIDGQPKASARPKHPGVILSFDSKFGPLKYACDTFTEFADNVRAIALGLEALRRVERYGITRRGEQYKGWSQLGAGTVMGETMSKHEAWRVLHDIAGTQEGTLPIEKLWPLVAKRAHPDTGGSDEMFQAATRAREVLTS